MVSMDMFLFLKNDYEAEEERMSYYNSDFEEHRYSWKDPKIHVTSPPLSLFLSLQRGAQEMSRETGFYNCGFWRESCGEEQSPGHQWEIPHHQHSL